MSDALCAKVLVIHRVLQQKQAGTVVVLSVTLEQLCSRLAAWHLQSKTGATYH